MTMISVSLGLMFSLGHKVPCRNAFIKQLTEELIYIFGKMWTLLGGFY